MAECTPSALVGDAACFNCLPKQQQLAVQTYLLTVVVGVEPDPAALLEAAECFLCLNDKQLLAIQASLLCELTAA